eukprot:scaffold11739_cov129-Isochrysis_galbana.AAC.1
MNSEEEREGTRGQLEAGAGGRPCDDLRSDLTRCVRARLQLHPTRYTLLLLPAPAPLSVHCVPCQVCALFCNFLGWSTSAGPQD